MSKLKTWEVLDRIGAAKAVAVEIHEPEALSPQSEPSKPVEEKKAEKSEKKPAKKAKADAEADA